MKLNIRRGDIWLVNFAPVVGHEQNGARPSVVITSDLVNIDLMEMAFVIPGTKTAKTDPKTNEVLADVVRVEPSSSNNLQYVTYFLCSQLRAVSLKRFCKTVRIGVLNEEQLSRVREILIEILDLES
ncbi:MAG: type II toxin-antitoxin system PemK/MazF family toxin [Candidatus Obscuribacter sp.]|nr:type II toxin-antitoxin system PemK/MazF family toxin [Candidatus Obscuribacter sp.]MBK9619312.1 type II toxin-antitoxin system PemK/MazF family toxin [Candidatus Obscuribacter sp.]